MASPIPMLEARPRSGPPLLFADHHCAIENACNDLRAACFRDDSLAMVTQYRNFECGVVEHIEAEELLLPAYAADDPDDAQYVREHHAALRDRMYRLAVDVELHRVRATAIDALIASLRELAAHEERQLYPWAREHLANATKRALFVRLARSLQTLARHRHAAA